MKNLFTEAATGSKLSWLVVCYLEKFIRHHCHLAPAGSCEDLSAAPSTSQDSF